MPLHLIKKLAVKLLGKPAPRGPGPAAKGAAPKKGALAATSTDRGGKEQAGGGRPPARRGASGGAGADGRRDGGARRSPRGDGRRSEGERRGGGRDERRPQDGQAAAGVAPAATAPGRPVARPPFKDKERRGRGGYERGERPVSDLGMQRPGGAVADDVVEKRRVEHASWSPEQFQVEPAEGKKRFHDFDLPAELMHGIAELGFQYCTPIQALSLEHALAGKNVTGKAQTGTGKTAAFLVAILTRYMRSPEARQEHGGMPRALVIAPTRELVIQICKDAATLGKYCGLRSLAVYGGMDYDRQRREVSDAPVDLLVATPGRLLDFMRSRVIDLSKVDTLVIDEADRMLDMGFIPDVRSIINRLPPKDKRCTMLYSATLTDDVMRLASQWMEAPVRVETETEQVTTKTVKQIVYVVTANEKFTVLYNLIQQYPDSRILVFCNRRNTTEDVADSLSRRGIRCEMLSGDVNQNRRLRVLEDFREGKVRIVVATDVAGRGLHVDDIGFVVNFDFPYEPEDYVHRIGRTGRAGASGTAISFADEDESFIIPEIEKYISEELKCTVLTHDDPLLVKLPARGQQHVRREAPPPQEVAAPTVPTPVAEKAEEKAAEEPQQVEPQRVEPKREEEKAPARAHAQPQRRQEEPAAAVAAEAPRHHHRAEERAREPQPRGASGAPAARPARFSADWVPGQGAK